MNLSFTAAVAAFVAAFCAVLSVTASAWWFVPCVPAVLILGFIWVVA